MLRKHIGNLEFYFDCKIQNGKFKLLFLFRPTTWYFPFK